MKVFEPAETATFVASGTDAHRYSPARRYRRRLMRARLKPLPSAVAAPHGTA